MSRYVRVDSAMAPSPLCPARRPSAFTLVELLIVVSIIALLLTMLTPSLRRARYLTLRVICLSNMNQQHAALYNYATANRGACHLDGLTYFIGRGVTAPELGFAEPLEPSDPADQARLARTMQDFLGLFNPLGLCKFLFLGKVGPTLVARWLAAATGWQVAPDELARLGERQFQLKRLINVRLGVSRQDDRLPRRLATHPRPDGKAAGVLPDLEAQLRAYYAQRGWSPEGVPLPETLSRLGLAELATTPIPGESPA